MEVYQPFKLPCTVSGTQAEVLVPAGDSLVDNVEGFVTAPCNGCGHWSAEEISRIERELKAEFGEQSGIRDGRVDQLQQLLVDRSRFKGGEHQLVVAICSPIDKSVI